MTARNKKAASKKAVRVKRAEKYSLPAWRYQLAIAGIGLLGLLLVGRIAALQVLPDMERGHEFLQREGELRTIRDVPIPAYRGSILDRNGRPLAVSTPLVDITADLTLLQEEDHEDLADVMGMTKAELLKKMSYYAGKDFMYLKRGLEPSEAEPILSAGILGIEGEKNFRRYYPDSEVVAHTLGLMHSEGYGIEGLELGFEDWLSGTEGSQRVVIDGDGRVVDYLGIISPVEPGKDLQLTIDLELQYIAYKALKAAFVRHDAKFASMVVMDPKTGEILAMASQPSFNPNNREQLHYEAVRNRALLDAFEPGSTVKPFTMMAALESGIYQPNTLIDTSPGHIWVGSKLIADIGNYKTLDLSGVLAKSSQVGTVKVALSLDEDQLFETFQRVGLGEPAVTGFPGEVSGSLPERYRWNDIKQVTFAYGYGLEATTLQLAQAYSVLANNGLRVYPSLIKGEITPPPERVASAEIVQQVNEMMREVIEDGTGENAAVEHYSVAGKTGTGHLSRAGGYEDHKYSSLFAGMAPATDPQLVAVIVITDPKGDEYYGGLVAAPVFSEVVGNALRILNVPGDQEETLLGYRQ